MPTSSSSDLDTHTHTGCGSANPLLAEILATPIRPVGPGALWRDGIGMGELVAAVRDRYPNLHSYGVGYSPRWGWKWEPDGMEKARAEMTEPGNVEQFERAFRFLNYAGIRFYKKSINTRRTSYSWKHVAERVMGAYVSNGMLVTAAYALGYRVAVDPGDPNPCINLASKAAALDPQKGLG